MPDFEALIRHQQLKQPTTNQRLKVVERTDFKTGKNESQETMKSTIMSNLFGGFIGSIIGTTTIIFLYINDYLPMDFLKFR